MGGRVERNAQARWMGGALLLIAALLVPGAVSAEEGSVAEHLAAAADPEVVEMVVLGLSCPFCAFGLEKRLRAGIEDLSDLEMEAQTGRVTFRVADGSKYSDDDLREIVKKAGFSVDELERTPVGRGIRERA